MPVLADDDLIMDRDAERFRDVDDRAWSAATKGSATK
jgi:hypothetical protein